MTSQWRGRMWSLGFQATSALALGLGLLPLIGGLASLWLPERRDDPAWRAFAAFTASAIVTTWTYTAVKAAYLSTVFATRVEERNLIYLQPLLIVGTAVWIRTGRRFLPGALAAWAFTTWLVLYYGYQLDFPYFEAPGYGIAAMANRAFRWDQHTIRIALAGASALLLAAILVAQLPRMRRLARPALLLVAAGALAMMLAGEVTSSRGSAIQSKAYADNLTHPFDWVDRIAGSSGVTFIGQDISTGDALGLNLMEFWNRDVKNVWSLDGTAPGPGPTLTPDLKTRRGVLSHDADYPFVLATDRIQLDGSVVARRPGLTLLRVPHPLALHEASYGVASDGWITGTSDDPVAHGTFAYFGPETTPGCAPRQRRTHRLLLERGAAGARHDPGRAVAAERAERAGRPPADRHPPARRAELPVEGADVPRSLRRWRSSSRRRRSCTRSITTSATAATWARRSASRSRRTDGVAHSARSRSGCLRTNRATPAQCQSVRRVSHCLSVIALCSCVTTAAGTYQRSQPARIARYARSMSSP